MIIDCHVHLNNYHEQVAISLDESLDKLQAAMAEADVDYALVLTSYLVSPHRPSAAEVIKAIEKVPNLGVVAGISFSNYKEKTLRELADFLKDGLVKGLKLYPGYEPFYPHDSRLRVVYDLAEEFDVPVMIHSGDTYNPGGKVKYSRPIEIDEVAVDHPNVKIVICHLGNPWLVDCMEVVYKNRNVFADISGLVLGQFSEAFEDYMQEQIEDVILYAGEPGYLLYGTDWPICNMRSYLKFMNGIDLPDEKKELIMWKNSAELFKIPVTEKAGV
jgi:predicted TIM-barrel fold metal-dependent hydrolase